MSQLALVEVKTTLRLQDDLLIELKHLAIDEKTTINSLIIEGIKEVIKKRKSKGNGKK